MGRDATQRRNRLMWLWIWLIQFAAMLALSLLAALSILAGRFVHNLCLWLLLPLAGGVSACIATRKGLLNYAAWIAPPVMEFAASRILWGYAPEVAPVFFCAFISLVGAATGEVLKRSARK